MTLRADTASSAAIVVPLRPARGRGLLQGFIVPIADSVAAVMFDETSARPDERPRLTAQVDGEPLGRPLISTSLALRQGGRRHVMLVGRGARALAESRVTLELGSEAAAVIDPDWLQRPLADEAALVTGLSDLGRQRLARLFLASGVSLFGSQGGAEFTRAAHRLLDLLGVPAFAPVAWCPAGAAGTFLTFRIDGKTTEPRVGTVVALSSRQIGRLTGCQFAAEDSGRAGLLHVYVPHVLPAGGSLISFGESPIRLNLPEAAAAPRALVPWLAGRDARTKAWVQGLVEPAADTDPVAAALLREMCCDDAEPVLTTCFLAATPAGVLYAFELSDPHDLVRAVRIERGGGVCDVEPGIGAGAAHSLAGYADVSRRSQVDDRYRLRLVYRSGRVRTAEDGRLGRYAGDLPAVFPAHDAGAMLAVARARLTLERPAIAPGSATFGTPPDRPSLSVIAAVGANLDLIRARAAMLFAEPGGRDVELLYHVTDNPLGAATRVAIADAAAVFGIAHRLLTFPDGTHASGRLLAAIAATTAPGILVFGADVLPAAGGWLAPWLCRLVSARPVLGATLLDSAGAVIHAGGGPGHERRHLGLPTGDLPASPAAATSLVCADCFGLTRAAADTLRDSAAFYPNPDVMLAETIERVRADGKEAATLLRCRFVRYADSPADRPGEAVDAAALGLVLKRSFNPSRHEGQA